MRVEEERGRLEGEAKSELPGAPSLQLPRGPWAEKGRVMARPGLEQSVVLGGGRSFIACDLQST